MSDSLLERINPFRLSEDVTLYQTLPNVAEPKKNQPGKPSKPDDKKNKPASKPAPKPKPKSK
jgi:hypothetical protein